MLIKRNDLDAIARGERSCVYRRWARPRVRAGSTFRTAVGVLAVDDIVEVDPATLTDGQAQRAGGTSRDDLMAGLGGTPGDPIFRIDLHLAGPDPRAALREQDDLGPREVEELVGRLDRLDLSSPGGPWTRAVLGAIAARPGVRAHDLAAELGMETAPFKRHVRKLKELGLTESLTTGYRISPRGRRLRRELEGSG